MKNLLSPGKLFFIAFALLIMANAYVLGGVFYNRSGAPDAVVELTGRELQEPYALFKENNAMSLRFQWNVLGRETDYDDYYYTYSRAPEWLDQTKLKSLGFDVKTDKKTIHGWNAISKQVFMVLELDGPAFRTAVERAEKGLEKIRAEYENDPGSKRLKEKFKQWKRRLKRLKEKDSRLFVIDAGLDPGVLRRRYANRSRFIITPGIVKIRPNYGRNAKPITPMGYINQLSVQSVHVPFKFSRTLETIKSRRQKDYRVKVAYGKRFEPWILSVRAAPE